LKKFCWKNKSNSEIESLFQGNLDKHGKYLQVGEMADL